MITPGQLYVLRQVSELTDPSSINVADVSTISKAHSIDHYLSQLVNGGLLLFTDDRYLVTAEGYRALEDEPKVLRGGFGLKL